MALAMISTVSPGPYIPLPDALNPLITGQYCRYSHRACAGRLPLPASSWNIGGERYCRLPS